MIEVDAWLRETDIDARMIMQVHDELVLEVGADAIDELVPELTRMMASAAELSIPLEVEVGVGDNWDDAH